MSTIAIFIFRRDLRLVDNTTLNKIKNSYKGIKILPIFIFKKDQIDKNKNSYYSSNSVQFLFECLDELSELNFYYSDNDLTILNSLKSKYKSSLKVIGFNKDYTPYARKRDEEIEKWCNSNNITLIAEEDYTLHKIGQITKDDNKFYLKFTPFYNKAIIKKPPAINNNNNNNNLILIKDNNGKSLKDFDFLRPKSNPNIKVNGGRSKALEILKKLKANYFKNYDEEREFPFLDKTTKLSAYIKFGCVSIREIYYCLPVNHGIVRELLWHDFYANITYFYPYIFGNAYNKKYSNIIWNNNETNFNKWKEGKTGYPLVDASMRQLNETGWMHNRCRMIVASFLTKNLFIDWRKGEHYFATKLVDYDPSSNNGGWQWCASTGTDSQPYFRIFSPMAQLQKFDKDCLFVKKWIPELRDVDNKIILNWDKNKFDNKNLKYPKPIVDFSSSSKIFLHAFQQLNR
jgi:deoxyribodipyrimidine photo-lyase